MNLHLPLSAAAALSLAASSHAAVLVDWNLDTITGPTVNNAAFVPIPSGTATVADYLTTSDLGTGFSAGHSGLVWSSGNAGAGKLNLQRWDHPGDAPGSFGAGNGTPNNWLQFSLSAAAGYEFTIERIDLAAWRNGAGAPANWRFDVSTDNGTTWTPFADAHTETNAGDSVFREVGFTGSVTAQELSIRFVAYGPTGGTGNVHINQLSLEGSVIPEPSSGLLAALGSVLLLRRRRAR